MAKPPSTMAQLETRIMNRLQERKHGQTVKELQDFLNEPQSKILAVLIPLRDERFVTMSKNGVWTMVHDA